MTTGKRYLWAGIYKENQDDALAIMDEISSYRADIAYIKLLPDATPQTTWQFYNPDFLAAAVAYLPISVKYQAMISHDSAVMAPALSDIELKEARRNSEQSWILSIRPGLRAMNSRGWPCTR